MSFARPYDPLAPNKKRYRPVRWLIFFFDQTIIRVTEYKIPKPQSYCWIQYERYQCIHHYLTLPHVTFSVPRLMNLSWWMDNLSSLTLHLSPQVIRIKGQDTAGFKSALDSIYAVCNYYYTDVLSNDGSPPEMSLFTKNHPTTANLRLECEICAE